MVNIT
jgi:transposase InsO family protein